MLPAGLDARPVRSPVSDVEYLTVQRRRGAVLVERVSGGGSVLRTLALRKRFRVPAIAYDNSVGGLSADGRRLVLITLRRRSPRRVTELAVVDVKRMRLTSVLRLRGDFSFHALSPDARQMYLVQYAPWDISTYGIRVFDIPERRLRPGSVSEPAGSGAAMRGVPLTQAYGPAGRWHYMLFRVRGHPYLYSLDTVRRRAFRTVVDRLSGRSPRLWRVRLQPSPGAVSLVVGDAVLARVDTSTHRLIRPRSARRSTEGGVPWTHV